MHDIMLDLETMSTHRNAAIVAIGAVAIDIPGQRLGDRFYAEIDLESAVAHGGVMDPDTVLWWLRQPDEARAVFADDGNERSDIGAALSAFYAWTLQHGPKDALRLWGKGPEFDNAILAEAYKNYGMTPPWDFRNNRCYRTLAALFPDVPFVRHGLRHHAGDDAENQARHLLAIFAAHPALAAAAGGITQAPAISPAAEYLSSHSIADLTPKEAFTQGWHAGAQDELERQAALRVADPEPASHPEYTGDLACCPENEGYGCSHSIVDLTPEPQPEPWTAKTIDQHRAEAEAAAIAATLDACDRNVSAAARHLGISRMTFYRKAETLGLELKSPAPTTRPAATPGRLDDIRDAADKHALETTLAAYGGNRSAAARALDISRMSLYRLMDKHRLRESPVPTTSTETP